MTPEDVAAELRVLVQKVPAWSLADVMVGVREGAYVVMFRVVPSAAWVEVARNANIARAAQAGREALMDVMLQVGSGASRV